ncbi:MAG TPA: hypothetical protein PKM59_03795 [Thermodesulfobacteriota bacterium]|nr:hypothetical protein [Thermodesulfobacteriota bacterium]
MGLQSLVQNDIAKILARDGEAVTYKTTAIKALYEVQNLFDDMGGYIGARMALTVDNADVSAPAEGDTVTVGSDTWTVRKVLKGTKYHQLTCSKDEHKRY